MVNFDKFTFSAILKAVLKYASVKLGIEKKLRHQLEKLDIPKPQLFFKDKIDNSNNLWKPKIKYKPNALRSLDLFIQTRAGGNEVYSHPYEYEIDNFKSDENQLIGLKNAKFKSLETTPLFLINRQEEIGFMMRDLENCKEIAVDVENHFARSFQGLTCLLQISTRDADYIIDTLSLRSELQVLNEIFTKPNILKVFHSADLDITWLQRDLSIYVVNMFDTQQAAKKLMLPLSLSYLLKTYCQIDIDKYSKKSFQLADWRKRPLTESLIKYAREDTHYLLYIKDILIENLIEADNNQNYLLKEVYELSSEVCKKIYAKPTMNSNSYLNLLKKKRKNFNSKQLYALKELYRLRFEVAREEDESENYIMPNHKLILICKKLPTNKDEILDFEEPLVVKHLDAVQKIIKEAKDFS